MNYNYERITYPSSDGINTIHADIYTPKYKTASGVIQLAHGMVDHPGRYMNLIEFLTGEGYIFAGNHHLGHGRSVLNEGDFGYFAKKGGIEYLLADMHAMNKYLSDTYPTLPLTVFGHSMGSFITRLYVTRYPHSMRAVIIHGTGGKNVLAPVGRLLARTVALIKGDKNRSKLILALAFGSYNKHFDKSEGRNAWLSRDTEAIKGKKSDPLASFYFTASGYADLFRMLEDCNSKKWFSQYPKDMRTLIMSGDDDPVGNYGKGIKEVYKKLMVLGASDLELRLYEGARHELFNETNRDEIFLDMKKWLDGVAL